MAAASLHGLSATWLDFLAAMAAAETLAQVLAVARVLRVDHRDGNAANDNGVATDVGEDDDGASARSIFLSSGFCRDK